MSHNCLMDTTRETGKDLIGVLLGPPKTYCDIKKKSYCVLDPIGMFSNDGTLWRTYCVRDPISTYCGIVFSYWVQTCQFGYLNRVDTIRFRIGAWRTDTIGSYWVPKHNRHQSYCVPPYVGGGDLIRPIVFYLNLSYCCSTSPVHNTPYCVRHQSALLFS